MRVCSPDDSVSDCADLVRKQPVSVLFVIAPDQSLVGVVTRESLLSASWLHRGETVQDIMSTALVSCGAEAPPQEAADLLVHSGAPVVLIMEDAHLEGWIAPHDLAPLSHRRSPISRPAAF